MLNISKQFCQINYNRDISSEYQSTACSVDNFNIIEEERFDQIEFLRQQRRATQQYFSQQYISYYDQYNPQTLTTINQIKSDKYKTELCKSFQETGKCSYYEKCMYAHGQHELQSKNINKVQYKTKQCQAFNQTLTCCFGKRCHYIHTSYSENQKIKIDDFYQQREENYNIENVKNPCNRLKVFKELTSSD